MKTISNLLAAAILAGIFAIITGEVFAGDIAKVKSPVDNGAYGVVKNANSNAGEVAEKSDDTRPQVRVYGKNMEWDYGAWTLVKTDDEFDGISYSVYSDDAKPGTPMDFPFHNTTTFINVWCDTNNLSAYVGVSNGRFSPDYYGHRRTRVRYKFDDTAVKTESWHLWTGLIGIHPPSNTPEFIRRIMEHKFLVLELNMYGDTLRRFRFDLTGSAMAIAELRRKCGVR